MRRAVTPPVAVALMLVLMVAWLLWLGRNPVCACGVVKLWHSNPNDAQTSQMMFDPYSLTHVLHGLLAYAALRWLAPRSPWAWRLAAATALSVGWEAVENTSLIIDRYREETMANGYYGDSILNSFFDVLSLMGGFWLAWRLPVWGSVAVFFGVEAGLLWAIRDNLTLNVLMLLWPIKAIARWQAGG